MAHHLILGTLTDVITGESLPDTHDERYRQGLARMLIGEKGLDRSEIEPRRDVRVVAGDKSARVRLDLAVRVAGRVCLIIRYGPGSLVTRHRPAIGLSRLITSYQVPLVVVTNGRDADILDGATGERVGEGFDAIPNRDALAAGASEWAFEPISDRRAEVESRIVFAYEIDNACPCDDTVCRLS